MRQNDLRTSYTRWNLLIVSTLFVSTLFSSCLFTICTISCNNIRQSMRTCTWGTSRFWDFTYTYYVSKKDQMETRDTTSHVVWCALLMLVPTKRIPRAYVAQDVAIVRIQVYRGHSSALTACMMTRTFVREASIIFRPLNPGALDLWSSKKRKKEW